MDELQYVEGLRFGGTNISSVRFADDTVSLADTEEKLQGLMDGLDKACQRNGLTINIEKTEE